MLISDYLGEDAVLGYCGNVHPGNSAQDIIRLIETDVQEVQKRVSRGIRFGLGMWMPANTVDGFLEAELLGQLKAVLRSVGVQIFSWNAFPYYDFHKENVKSEVYKPDWSERARIEYTLRVLQLIQKLSPNESEISISTLPIADQGSQLSQTQITKAAAHLVEFVSESFRLERESGLNVHLDLEPEPLCFLQTSMDVVHFFKEYLFPYGIQKLRNDLGLTRGSAEELILDKIRVCYDTCHAAMMYESPREILDCYESIGAKVGKVQLSSALVLDLQSEAISEQLLLLKDLSQDRYLHQVIGRQASQHSENFKFESYRDLPEALHAWGKSSPSLKEYRIHYHVPLFMRKFDCLLTTQNHILELFQIAQKRPVSRHWEVETYTWPSLNVRPEHIPENIALEINWVKTSLEEAFSKEKVSKPKRIWGDFHKKHET